MAKYKVILGDNSEIIEATSIQRDEGYLILVNQGEIVSVYARWDYVAKLNA